MAQFASEVSVGKSAAAASEGTYDDARQMCVGKQTLSEQLAPADPRLAKVKAQAGKEFEDAGFGYVVTEDGSFRCTKAPAHPPSVGVVITMTGKWAPAWIHLADKLEPVVEATAPAPEAKAGDVGAQPAQPADKSAEPPADKSADNPAEPAAASTPADTTGIYWVATPNCMVRTETGKEVRPQPLKQYMHVRVLARHTQPKFTGAKVATVDGEEIGWVSFPHLVELKRPARPSTSAKQMAAVLAAASAVAGNKPHGACYNNVKHHILNAGGYGDILDIYNDERFIGCQVPAVSFAEAVERAGAAAMGLQRVSGLPKDAEPGTLLILRGNGKARLDMVNGDISVIASHEKGVVRCYNDGTMTLMADEKHWGAGGHMENAFVAMYKPIDRD